MTMGRSDTEEEIKVKRVGTAGMRIGPSRETTSETPTNEKEIRTFVVERSSATIPQTPSDTIDKAELKRKRGKHRECCDCDICGVKMLDKQAPEEMIEWPDRDCVRSNSEKGTLIQKWRNSKKNFYWDTAWEQLGEERKKLFGRYDEVYSLKSNGTVQGLRKRWKADGGIAHINNY
ncbi:hypothetical protein P167DRAFT_590706 [Morchella conica CCBAS932]|uniref:Uncharacterized protein n=1 Tax=Morchella conica CCBAS932 TaxID=1392247 RepID=A0A3N4K7I5_9PEZI|nr:hypothetical protein P167DRAFT_590706 [Morchella conica CCBAS932]